MFTLLKRLTFVLLTFCFTLAFAQQKPQFWDDIQKFKEINEAKPLPKDPILFLGSSSFTMWQDVNDYFPGKIIVNRGFGGSSLKDLMYYSTDLLKPYHPRQIIIYCGENDFSADPLLSSKQVFERYKHFYKTVRSYYPEIPVSYVSIKMSPSRKNLWKQFAETNSRIEKFMKKQKNASYIDITKGMEDGSGNVREDIFLNDMLHMKPSGYQIWANIIDPYLK